MLKRLILILSSAAGFLAFATGAHAAVLENAFVILGDPRSAQTGTTHDYTFQAINGNMGSVSFRYCVTPSGTCTDPGLNMSTIAVGTVQQAGSPNTTWTAAWDDGNNWIAATRDTADTSGAGVWRFLFNNADNPARTSCTFTTNTSTGSCYVRINSYTNTDLTGAADDTVISITVTEAVTVTARVDPTFTMLVAGVTGTGQTVNGTVLTTSLTTTATTLPFGNLTADTEKFAAQTITVTTNAPGGYTVDVRFQGTLMTGTAFLHDIDSFKGNSATTDDPGSWTAPTGTSSGVETGWVGVGSSDTGIPNWAANEFYRLGTQDVEIADSSISASSRVSNIVYGLEVNAFQQADNYTGTLVYTAVTTF
jgi:hypothetical protein